MAWANCNTFVTAVGKFTPAAPAVAGSIVVTAPWAKTLNIGKAKPATAATINILRKSQVFIQHLFYIVGASSQAGRTILGVVGTGPITLRLIRLNG